MPLPASLAGLALVSALSLGALHAGGPAAPSPGDEPRPAEAVMKEMAEAFADLEQAVDEDADGRGQRALDRLGRAATRLPDEAAAPGATPPPGARRHATRLAELVDEMRVLWHQGRRDGVRQAFADLRGTCVSCHAAHRDGNAGRGDWPAVGATLTGRVRLLDVDGDEYEDASSVLLFLENRAGAAPYVPDRLRVRVRQRDRTFTPRVLPVVVGTTVEFPNDDAVFHNVFSLSKAAPFDLGLYEAGESRSVLMERTGLVKVYCNIHPDMAASVVVLREPWFTRTDAAGRWTITGVPDGAWNLRAWNDRGVEHSVELELQDGDWREVELVLEETQRVLPHKNKFGRPYRKKY